MIYLSETCFPCVHYCSLWRDVMSCSPVIEHPGPVSLRLMTSQFKDIVNHTEKMKTVKCIFCGVWDQHFCMKFQRCPLKFHTKFWTYTPQNMHFTRCLKFDDLWYLKSYDILSLSETGPWSSYQLQRLALRRIKHQNNSTSNGRQVGMPYCIR